jgi:DNA polymerase V
MCAPWFQVKDQFKKNEIIALSSNFGLYADMSNRVGNILALFSPRREVYSIDESFLDLSGFGSKDLTRYGKEIKQTILQWTGLPVCIGIGSTKTLAMLANHCAKKRPQYAGVCNFNTLTPQAVD